MSTHRRPPIVGDDGWCFVCGVNNPIGLKTTWQLRGDGVATTRFTPSREHQGWTGVVHGGILAALLDEAMAKRLRLAGVFAVTARLSVRYRRAAPTTEVLIVEGRIVSEGSRGIRMASIVRSESGECFAEAEGTCVRTTATGFGPDSRGI